MAAILPESTLEKVSNIKGKVLQLIQKSSLTIRSAMRNLEVLTGAINAVPWAKVHIRDLQQEILRSWNGNIKSLNSKIIISHVTKNSLRWWLQDINLTKGKSFQILKQVTVTTDASHSGWGGHLLQNKWVQDKWRGQGILLPSNMKAIHLTLLFFAPVLKNQSVLIQSDNYVAVHYVNRQGGTRSRSLLNECRRLFAWARSNLLDLQAVHIKGTQNSRVDLLSQETFLPGEWSLSLACFQKLIERWGSPVWDIMATQENHKLSKF
ncbi:uncharacterized protein LOC130273950 [Hyla sarda]|uniref:uncharacterized protein LOC130273950 n=1 Tax=Hyla sarda TaxID=327740 RepID=UPI0024C20E2F|nr:uncharacterized protein LOC130273950 [Hyla sarda]